MNDLWISFFVFAVIFGGALLGMIVRPLLSESHLHPDSRDAVKMATGLIGTLAALVLGLLIAWAKSSFDQKTNQVRQLTATVILLPARHRPAGTGGDVQGEDRAEPATPQRRDRPRGGETRPTKNIGGVTPRRWPFAEKKAAWFPRRPFLSYGGSTLTGDFRISAPGAYLPAAF